MASRPNLPRQQPSSLGKSSYLTSRLDNLMKSLALACLLLATVCVVSTSAKSLDLTHDLDTTNSYLESSSHRHHQATSLHHQSHSLHHHNRNRRLQRRDSNSKDGNNQHCNDVRVEFEAIDIKLPQHFNEKGAQCGGHCCTNSTEIELRKKAAADFERSLHHHTKSLRGILESTANLFESHVLELAQQSENRTLNVFSQVYKRMLPLSRKLIVQLYSEITSNIKSTGSNALNANTLESVIHKFFVNLFPVAYHQVVHLNKQSYGELHEDYINCLKHVYDDVQPFGTIPKEISRNLMQSIQTAHIFINALHQSAEVLSETDDLYAAHLSESCQRHLLKMSYCPRCNGLLKSHVKTCYSYCMNVLRGCSAQYAGVLDSPWSNVVDALDNLVTMHIRSDTGIVTVIKQLDGKLSETIMKAMENGPELEKLVKKTCGTPRLLPSSTSDSEHKPQMPHNMKWATPVDSELLRFLSTIDKSKDFYSNIVNNVCDDEEMQRSDRHCWMGDRIGDYTQLVMTPGTDTQRYNPEVPFESTSQPTKLNEMVDKLLKVRKTIATAIPSTTRTFNDVQSDMAGRDDEGSGRMPDDVDDDEYRMQGSGDGDGSGDGATSLPYDPRTNNNEDNEILPPSTKSPASKIDSSMSLAALFCLLLVMHQTFSTTIRSYKLKLN
ncbi:division abnormally delayed protein [Stomoxys calcitrans]|uniref:division abnormally delayed protein n=1 Tax=Stomoxys calcitrans TaxID=35570 RepID=UPI0027E23849|nr:division abnormally delayed protein [Stomoxys calcitrans]